MQQAPVVTNDFVIQTLFVGVLIFFLGCVIDYLVKQ